RSFAGGGAPSGGDDGGRGDRDDTRAPPRWSRRRRVAQPYARGARSARGFDLARPPTGVASRPPGCARHVRRVRYSFSRYVTGTVRRLFSEIDVRSDSGRRSVRFAKSFATRDHPAVPKASSDRGAEKYEPKRKCT